MYLMSDLVTPTTAPVQHDVRPRPDRTPTRYDWNRIELGTWQRWQDAKTVGLPFQEAHDSAERIRAAAKSWAKTHNLRLRIRRLDQRRTLDLLFTRPEDE
jgi:hypothetical protein